MFNLIVKDPRRNPPERTAWIGESQHRCGPRTCCAAFLRELIEFIEVDGLWSSKFQRNLLFAAHLVLLLMNTRRIAHSPRQQKLAYNAKL
jgi:hypothetical protein